MDVAPCPHRSRKRGLLELDLDNVEDGQLNAAGSGTSVLKAASFWFAWIEAVVCFDLLGGALAGLAVCFLFGYGRTEGIGGLVGSLLVPGTGPEASDAVQRSRITFKKNLLVFLHAKKFFR